MNAISSNPLVGRVLLIDDEPEIGELISAAAEHIGLACTATTDVAQFRLGLTADVSLVIVDLMMPGTDGVELLRQLGAEGCRARVMLISGFDKTVLRSAEELARSHGLDVVGRLQKPFRISEVETLLKRAVTETAAPKKATKHETPVDETDLLRAIGSDAFVIHYQPQVYLATGRVAGAEALVRMLHPVRGVVYPDLFIATAERLRLIDTLTLLVLRRAISEFSALSMPPDATLSINVSALSLTDLGFPDRLEPLAEKSGVPRSSIVLEITESGLIRELAKALDILARLRMKHFGLSIDDFGTGYSAMAQLRRVPATELKIDKIFVNDMLADDGAKAVVDKTIALGHELGMKIVAEGVETAEQAAALNALGCDIGQGYYFSRPIPVPDFRAWIAAGR